jgi:hypothetical protein
MSGEQLGENGRNLRITACSCVHYLDTRKPENELRQTLGNQPD